MYPNQYGNPQQNIGFNPNIGQQQGGVPYPNQNQGGLPYPVYPPQQSQSPGFPQQSSPYPPAPGAYPPQLPNSGGLGYPPNQQSAYSPQPPPTGYPGSQPGGYPSPGYNPNQGGYPSVGGYPAPNSAQPGYGSPYPGPPQPTSYPPQQSQLGYSPQSQSNYPSAGQPPYHQPVQPQSFGSIPPSGYPTQQFTSSKAHSYGATPTVPHSGTGAEYTGVHAMQAYNERPTVVAGHFDPVGDCATLRKAMKGFGTDEAAIINVICKRTNAQRLQIAQAFKTSYGKDLIKDLKSELGGRFEEVVLALMTPRFDYMAMTLQKAIAGIGTKEKSLVDILCTATNEEIRMISASYQRLYGRMLERDLMGDTSGHFRRLLVSIISAGRMENQPADPTLAANDVKALYSAGVNKMGTDEATFNQILCLRSFAHLRLVFQEYEKTYGQSFEKVISNEFSGDIESGLKAVVACAKNRAAYFASRLHESFAGFGTKDDDVVFIITTRCEIDLQNIKEEYQRNYNKTLESAIASETSGDYKKALIALLGN